MRNIEKIPVPQVLIENKENWDQAVAENPSKYNKKKYKHPEIKRNLLQETHYKCVYCESKIGHNCPGDIEHKIPKSVHLDLIFDWDNMTIACNECNRRKLEYYDPQCMFLDPNRDDVESLIQHLGPLVFNRPGSRRSEITIRLLELDQINRRKQLIGRKFEKLEHIRNLIERITSENNPLLKQLLFEHLGENYDVSAEFSGMIKAYIENWLEQLNDS